MRFRILLFSLAIALLCACHREQAPQYITGFIDDISRDGAIVIDSMGSGHTIGFVIDENTAYEESGLIEGNIAEIMYLPTEDETAPAAISITTNDTYPKVLGRWATLEGEKTPIEIELLSRGRVAQLSPEGVLEYTAWQLMAKEDTIRLIGRVSLPPEVAPKKKGEKAEKKSADTEEEAQPALRREQAFSAVAVVGVDSDRRTLTIITNKGVKSKLYKRE